MTVLDEAGAEGVFDLGLDGVIRRGYAAHRLGAQERARSRQLCDSLARLRRSRPLTVDVPEPRVVHTDAAGVIIEPTQAAAKWLNVPAGRLVGMRLLHFVGRRDTGVFRAIVKGLGYAGATRTATVRFRPRQGRPELVQAMVEKVAPDRYAWTLRSIASIP